MESHIKYSKGVCWVADCRIPFVDEVSIKISGDKKHLQKWKERDGRTPRDINEIENTPYENTKGRFTPNLLVCDDMLNDGKTYGNLFKQNRNKDVDGGTGNSLVRPHKEGESNGVFDGGTSSSRFYDLDLWFDNLIERL